MIDFAAIDKEIEKITAVYRHGKASFACNWIE